MHCTQKYEQHRKLELPKTKTKGDIEKGMTAVLQMGLVPLGNEWLEVPPSDQDATSSRMGMGCCLRQLTWAFHWTLLDVLAVYPFPSSPSPSEAWQVFFLHVRDNMGQMKTKILRHCTKKTNAWWWGELCACPAPRGTGRTRTAGHGFPSYHKG